MAFRLGNASGSSVFGSGAMATNNAQTQTGPDLEEIQTEALGFHSIAGEAKVRLLPSPWPSDALPPPTSSLMSIASNKGLIAAAGPNAVIIASTESVRQAFSASDSEANDIKPFSPQLTIPIGMRISQVAFSADESFLVISAESGGGLAVYDVPSIMQGNTQTAFELSTNGVALRALSPNPTPEKAELFAAVTVNGDLMMANIKTRQFLSGVNGQVMKNGVSCVSWSTRGKQLVAGLGNGTGFQMTPEGEGKAEIPRPPGMEGDPHVSSISWLENNVFLIVHTPSSFDSDHIPASNFHLVTRQPPSSFMYQRLSDPCPPYGINRSPAFQFIQRLKDYPPNIQDILVVASTGSTDIGLFSRSKSPLTSEAPAEKITNVFTTTGMANDSRRAAMPMTEEMTDTSPIGVALDLSSRENVKRPLPGEEIDMSPTPLPALMVLNNEGILASWWIVYSESVRQGTPYPGLAAIAGSQHPQPLQKQQPAFGQSTFGGLTSSTNNLGGAFGEPPTPAFGTTSAPFGIGKPQSPWTASTSAGNVVAQTGQADFGKPAFGSSTPIGGVRQGAAFGATGGIGNQPSPWGGATSSTPTNTGSTFGQPGGLGMRTASAFVGSTGSGVFGGNGSAQTPAPAPASGGFGSYANSGGFATAASQGTGESIFGKPNGSGSFGSGMDTDTSFGGTPKKTDRPTGLFETGGTGAFSLGSTFKGDGSAKDDAARPATATGGSFFGTGFGNALGNAPTTQGAPETKEADMEEHGATDVETHLAQQASAEPESTTPAAAPASAKSQIPSTEPPATGGLFGTQAQSNDTPAAVQSSEPAALSFGKPTTIEPPKDMSKGPDDEPNLSDEALQSPKIKPDPEDERSESPVGVDKNIPEAPLPPDSTSKTSYAPGDSSASSTAASKDNHDDAPLPPDFIPTKPVPRGKDGQGEPPVPFSDEDDEDDDEDDGLDEEGSGEDIAQDLSPTTDPNQSPKVTPESSFGGGFDRSPVGGLFTNIPRQAPQQNTKPLFGEIGSKPAPFFPPPTKVQESPRSPSPIRSSIAGDEMRPDKARSLSAPGLQTKAIANRKTTMVKLTASNAGGRPETSTENLTKQEQDRLAALKARNTEEEQDLSDREDEKVREELQTEVEATTTLEPFLAHQDYVGNIKKPGIPGQIEKVYRDINSMVDTLGINARSLKAFIKGHEEMYKDGEREPRDLENGNDWCLIEIEDLSMVENDLAGQLEKTRIQDVQGMLSPCKELHKDLARVRAKHNDIKRITDARSDPEQLEALRSAPLTAEQAAIQHDLRKEFTHLQKLLADAEEAISMLRAKLASHPSSNNGGTATRQTVPTVEAVMKTVMTMTSMAEKKSGDIDVLENQMRKLRFSSLNADSAPGSREVSPSPLATPASKPSKHQPLRTPASIASSNLFFTPRSSLRNSAFKSSLGSSLNGTPSRKKLNAVTADDAERCRVKARRRREVCKMVREKLLKGGPRVRGFHDL
ncbi:MAG: hypothetical protein M1830_003919 [Pleopsidium flavum]|nr:MAG: hypothetical protein M1830_003919 [Pleopsidium flavum]